MSNHEITEPSEQGNDSISPDREFTCLPIPINHYPVLLSAMDEITQAILHAKPCVCPTQIYRLQTLIYDSLLRARKTGALSAIIKRGSSFCAEKNYSRCKKVTKGTK